MDNDDYIDAINMISDLNSIHKTQKVRKCRLRLTRIEKDIDHARIMRKM